MLEAHQKTCNFFCYHIPRQGALQQLHSGSCISVELLLIERGHADERSSFPKMDKNTLTWATMDKTNSGMCFTPILLMLPYSSI